MLYEGSDSASFTVSLKPSESYSITFPKTEDGTDPEGYGISLICEGHDILQGSYAGLHVIKDGDEYIFTQVPSTPKTVEIRISIDGVEIGYITIEISREPSPLEPKPEPEPDIPVVTFNAEIGNPEIVSIISSVDGASIYYTLDGTDPTSSSLPYLDPLDISTISGDKTLKAKAFNGTVESDIAVLDRIIKDSTYIIYSEDGLREWASSMPSIAAGGVPGILGKDIALPSTDEGNGNWTPIYEYTGTFDGRNHTISGLTVKNNYAAFFEVLYGNVKNMKLTDVDVEGGYYAGGIAGVIDDGTISGCEVSGTVSGGNYGYAGGIVGSASGGSISDSVSSVTVSGYESGGIIGTSISSGDTVSISGCEVDGKITGNSSIGGIAGRASGMDIDTCTNNSTVTGNKYVGGIAGISENSSSIKGCTNNGDVTGSSQIGGIVGLNSSSEPIELCTNNGKIDGTGDSVGGIVGDTTSTPGTEIIECINSASVIGKDEVGGICGSLTNESSIIGCRNDGDGTISGNSFVGGITGYISSSEIMYCYNKMNVTASNNGGGIAGGSARRLSCIIGCYNTADIKAANSSGGIIGYADPSDSFEACYSTGSAYYGIGGPEDDWGEGPSFSACYWSGLNGGGGGINISGIKQVSSWTEDIMNNLNNAITSPSQYLYEKLDLQSNEPYMLVKQEATT